MRRCPSIPTGLCVACVCGAKKRLPALLGAKYIIRALEHRNTFIYYRSTYQRAITRNRLNLLKT